MVQPQATVSFFIDDLVEGGGPPIQQNLRIQSSAFVDFDYNGAAPMGTALLLKLLTDAGQVVDQHYSCGPKQRVQHTPDGRFLTAPPSKTSNFGILMAAMANAGVPKATLSAGDISALTGLYAYWDGQTVTRTGLPGENAQRNTVVAVPTLIHELPGQAPQAVAPTAPAAPPMPTPAAAPAPAPPMSPPKRLLPRLQLPLLRPLLYRPLPAAAEAMTITPADVGVPYLPPLSLPRLLLLQHPPCRLPSLPLLLTPLSIAAIAAANVAAANAAAAANVALPTPEAVIGAEHTGAINDLIAGINAHEFSKQDLMVAAYTTMAANPVQRDSVSNFIFTPAADLLLATLGYTVNGNSITLAAG